jgi:endonuclease/exonuclease/phosphatase (EEP) superfamily protein YafD
MAHGQRRSKTNHARRLALACARLRNGQLRAIAARAKKSNAPVIVLGDLNFTPWSPYFRELLRDGGLRNTSQGHGLHASWPALLPMGRIPLDHCLVSPEIRVSNKQVGPYIGSDHLPVMVEVLVPPP